MEHMDNPTATVISSGPNGLSAAIVLAAAGIPTTVFEKNSQPGGGCSSAEMTLPGFIQDLGPAAYPAAGKSSVLMRGSRSFYDRISSAVDVASRKPPSSANVT